MSLVFSLSLSMHSLFNSFFVCERLSCLVLLCECKSTNELTKSCLLHFLYFFPFRLSLTFTKVNYFLNESFTSVINVNVNVNSSPLSSPLFLSFSLFFSLSLLSKFRSLYPYFIFNFSFAFVTFVRFTLTLKLKNLKKNWVNLRLQSRDVHQHNINVEMDWCVCLSLSLSLSLPLSLSLRVLCDVNNQLLR